MEEGFRTAWKQQAFSGLRFTEANFLCRRGMKCVWHSCPREQEPRGASWPLMEKLPETPLALMLYLRLRAVKKENGASLVAQWLRICLSMQGTRVQALVWEDPTCRRAARPVSHNY